MPGIVTVLGAVLLICLLSSTREGRAKAAERLRPLERALIIPAAALWLWIAFEVARAAAR